MCGIAGLFVSANAAPPRVSELEAMVAMLGHRGPDGYGIYRDGRAGLAHARLSIGGGRDHFQTKRLGGVGGHDAGATGVRDDRHPQACRQRL